MLNAITWSVDPALFTIMGREIRWYGLFFALGFLIGYQIIARVFKRDNAPDAWTDKIFMYVFIATVIGARLGHCFFYAWDYYSAHPWDIFKIWEGGLASHGGTLGIMIAIFIYSKRVTHLNPLWTFDRVILPVGLVAAFIRLGNLMNHEIYGHPTGASWGFRFIENLSAWRAGADPIYSLPSHPTQLYEAACYLLTFAIVMYLYWRRNAADRQGLLFGIFLIGIFLSRFLIEYVKNVQEEFESVMVLNMGQILSIPFILLGIFLVIRALTRPPKSTAIPSTYPVKSAIKSGTKK